MMNFKLMEFILSYFLSNFFKFEIYTIKIISNSSFKFKSLIPNATKFTKIIHRYLDERI